MPPVNATPSTPPINLGPITPMSGTQALQQATQQLAPLAHTFTTQNNLGSFAAPRQVTPAASTDVLSKLSNFVGQFGGQVGNLVGGVATTIATDAINSVEAPFKLAGNLIHEGTINANIDAVNKQLDLNQTAITSLQQSYHSGRITQKQYKDGVKNLLKDATDLNKTAQSNMTDAQNNATDTATQAISTAGDVIAVVSAVASAGLSTVAVAGAEGAVDGSVTGVVNFFGQRAVGDTLATAATKIDSVVQEAIKTADFFTTFGGKFTAGEIAKVTQSTIGASVPGNTAAQIAKGVAVNLIIKKPLIYQTNIDIASGIYKDMLKGDLTGAALSTIATAAMALSGGPVGYALEAGGRGLSWLRAASFAGGNVANIMKAQNAANVAKGLDKVFTDDLIASQAKSSVSQQSFIDALSTHIGNGDTSQGFKELMTRYAAGDQTSYQAIKILEETNMKMAGGDSVKAAQLVADHYNGMDGGKFLKSANFGQVLDDMVNWAAARDSVVKDAIAHGMPEADAKRLVVGRATQSDMSQLAQIISAADSRLGYTSVAEQGTQVLEKVIQQRMANFTAAIDQYGRTAAWANSNTLKNQIDTIIRNAHDTQDMIKQIQSIKTGRLFKGVSKDTENFLQKHGYIAIEPTGKTVTPYIKYEDTTGGLKSAFANRGAQGITAPNGASLFEHAVAPVPVLASVTGFLTRIGLSPEASNAAVQDYFQSHFAQTVSEGLKNVPGEVKVYDGQSILSKLYSGIKDYNQGRVVLAPITDLRQMTTKNIQEFVGNTTKQEAQVIMASIHTSMLAVPLALRGAGDKLVDVVNALRFPAKFSRIQGSARFVWNPFFRWQQSYQTEALAQLDSGGKMLQLPFLNGVNKVLFGNDMARNAETIQILENKNIFAPGISGGASASADVQGLIGGRLIKSEKVSLAGVVNKQADAWIKANPGATTEDYINNNMAQVVDTMRTITTTNHTQGFLDSPLARTINTAFFPFRYNMKVANLMAGYIGKMSAPTQVALIGGLYNFNSWINSDQGIAWQTQNAQALNLFTWLSPAYPLSYVMKLGEDALGQQGASIGDLGQLGGLPFGMISQFLESNGVIQTQAPYINPTTGQVYPAYVPNTARAQVNLAIQDLLGSVFSYPGAIVGLPSKGSLERTVSNGLVGGGKEFTQVDQSAQLTPQQVHQQQIIKQTTGAVAATTGTPSSSFTPTQPANTLTNAPQPNVTANPRAPKPSAGAKKKKADFRPQPLT